MDPAGLLRGILTSEHRFWVGLDLSGMTVYKIGAFHGLVILFFASRAKAVVCFEPNASNYKRLMENLALNEIKNTDVRKVGVGSRCERGTMVGSPLMPGGASLDANAVRYLLAGSGGNSERGDFASYPDEELFQTTPPAPDLIKIDIEGWEIEALRRARNTLDTHEPALFLEMHGETARKKRYKVTEIVLRRWRFKAICTARQLVSRASFQ
jgi:FkbM family methyltransferase